MGDEHVHMGRRVVERRTEHPKSRASIEDDRVGAVSFDAHTRRVAPVAGQRWAATRRRAADAVKADVDTAAGISHELKTVLISERSVKGL
jgi:hypothetical protein